MGGVCSTHRRNENFIQNLVGKPEGKRQFEICRCRWEDIIRIDLRGIGWESVDWIHLVQDRDHGGPF
jgi:hypothetical protein